MSRKYLRGVRRDCDLRSSVCRRPGRPRAGAAAGLGARGPRHSASLLGGGAEVSGGGEGGEVSGALKAWTV